MSCIVYTLGFFVHEPQAALAIGLRATLTVQFDRSWRGNMERRVFPAASTTGALAHSGALAAADARDGALPSRGGKPLLLELRRYRLRNGPLQTRFSAYAKEA